MNRLLLLSRIALLWALNTVMFTSCDDSIVYEGEGDCPVHYRIGFKYDKNMKFADAFSHEVSSVALYVFDLSGVLVFQGTESGAQLADDYTMSIEVRPGEYELLAWCGLGDGESFTVPQAKIGVTTKDELVCKMNGVAMNGCRVVQDDLSPLFHGFAKVTLADKPGVHVNTISLTKNTNVVRVILQQLSGEDVEPDLFSFEIQDRNGLMAYDNSILDDGLVIYKPWNLSTGNADINAEIRNDVQTRASSTVGVVVAEMTTGRLVEENAPVLVVRNQKKGEVVLAIPLVDYALLVKGHYNRNMSDQDYLDRQDEYNLTFFLDESGRWISSSVVVNSWRVVLNNQTIN